MRFRALFLLLLSGCSLLVDPEPPPETGAECFDKRDNDADGDIDCADADCQDNGDCMS